MYEIKTMFSLQDPIIVNILEYLDFTSILKNIPLILVSIVIGYFVKYMTYKLLEKPSNIPDVTGGWFFFGQVFVMLKGNPWDSMARWVLEFGKVYKIQLFGDTMICVADPEVLKVILSTKLSIFKKDLKWTYKPFLVILGNGLVTADGLDHRHQRQILAKHFRTDILDYVPQMALEAFQRFVLKLNKTKLQNDFHKIMNSTAKSAKLLGLDPFSKENHDKNKNLIENTNVIEMGEEFRHLTLQVIAEAILSLPPEVSDQTFAHMYLPIVDEGNKRTWAPERVYLPNASWLTFSNDVKKLNDFVTKLIIKRRELRLIEKSTNNKTSIARKHDVLDMRMDAIDETDWATSTHEIVTQLCSEVKTFILAGHETSASMLTWALYELTRNPAYMTRLRDDALKLFKNHVSPIPTSTSSTIALDDNMKKNTINNHNHRQKYMLDCKSLDSLSINELNNGLVFAEACLRESLRRYSNVPSVVRIASEDIAIDKYFIKKDSTVVINIQGVHHNPEYWPNPLKYDPYRFLGGQEIKPFTFLPFIDGPRMCIGQYLSLLETKIVLSALVLAYDFEVMNTDTAGEKHAFMVPIIPAVGHFMKIS